MTNLLRRRRKIQLKIINRKEIPKSRSIKSTNLCFKKMKQK